MAGPEDAARTYVPLSVAPSGPRQEFAAARDFGKSGQRLKAENPAEALFEYLEATFQVRERGSSIACEVRAGLVTWVTMSYIVVVNPMILSAKSTDRGSLIPFQTACRATCISAAVASAFVGLWANLPFGLAAGMGLNSYLRYGVMGTMGLSPSAALACCFTQAVIFAVLAASGAADWMQALLPGSLKSAITVAIGIFQAFIGFQLMGLTVKSERTFVGLGDITQPILWLSVAGTLLVAVLLARKTKGALLVGICFVTACANILGLPNSNDLMGEVSVGGGSDQMWFTMDFGALSANFREASTAILCMLFIVVFDTAGVQHGIGQQAGLLGPDGRLPGANVAYMSSAVGTGLGALMGTSPVIIHNESAAGVQEGGRTGLCALTTAFFFLVSPLLVPLIELIPPEATAPCLVLVGTMMMVPVRDVDFTDPKVALPAFLIITVTPMTCSISAGIFFGILAYVLLSASLAVADAAAQLGARLGLGGAGAAAQNMVTTPILHQDAA